ncbi:MAG: hypothetical protein ABIO76_11750, partial [Ginsengibacter sp.]
FIGSFFFLGKKRESTVLLNDCNDPVTPPVPIGPYYKDEKLNRVDITDNEKGVPIASIFIAQDKHCKPIANAIVDIWQCDSDGRYSDFKKENTLNEPW